MQAVATTALAASSSIAVIVKSVSDEAVQITNLSKTTGIATKTLQEYKYAAESVGASADAVTSDLQMLIETMSSPIPGEFNETLFMMGIGIRDAAGKMKSADTLLGDIAEKLNGMNEQESLQWANRLGLSNDTLILIKKGKLLLRICEKKQIYWVRLFLKKHLKEGPSSRSLLMLWNLLSEELGEQLLCLLLPV